MKVGVISIMLRVVRKFCSLFGYSVQASRLTDVDLLQNLMRRLHPVEINIPFVRVGSERDGGYLVPADIENIGALFSPGVGSKQDLDHEFADRGVKVFMADASVEGPIDKHDNFVFLKKHLGAVDNDATISFEQWLRDCSVEHDKDLMLQMDIEGAEYEVIYSIPSKMLQQFRVIIVEFHQLDLLFDGFMFEKFKNVFLKILATHYCVHIHPNNCLPSVVIKNIEIPPVMEFSFIRKDCATVTGFASKFPHDLDVDCTSKATLVLPKCWYRST